METEVKSPKTVKSLNVLLVGNNPIEMSSILNKLNEIRSRKVITEIAFDLKSTLERLINFRPNYILIDDNIGKLELTEAIENLTSHRKTKNVPITVLKNSNYRESIVTSNMLDYMLKHSFSAESLLVTLRNMLKFRKTQLYLRELYKKRKVLLKMM